MKVNIYVIDQVTLDSCGYGKIEHLNQKLLWITQFWIPN